MNSRLFNFTEAILVRSGKRWVAELCFKESFEVNLKHFLQRAMRLTRRKLRQLLYHATDESKGVPSNVSQTVYSVCK